jgi:hypothetical protein
VSLIAAWAISANINRHGPQIPDTLLKYQYAAFQTAFTVLPRRTLSLNDIRNWFKMFFYSGGQECQAINPSNFCLNLDDISGFSRTEIFSYKT